MNEIFPIAAGVAIGALVQLIRSVRWRTVAVVSLSLLFGFAAAFISGEFEEGWEFILFDIPQVFVAAALTAVALTWWRSRQAGRS